MRPVPCFKVAVALFLLFPLFAKASPIHAHCDVQPWFENPALQVSPALPLVNPINVIAIPSFLQEAPTTAVPNCVYELSDITSIDVTLGIAEPGGDDGDIEFLFVPPQLPLAGAGPWTFSDGSSLFFAFPSHATAAAGDIHVIFPNDPTAIDTRIEVHFNAGLSTLGTTLKSIKMEFRGNHYFVADVPEPTSLALIVLGTAGLAAVRRRSSASGRR